MGEEEHMIDGEAAIQPGGADGLGVAVFEVAELFIVCKAGGGPDMDWREEGRG